MDKPTCIGISIPDMADIDARRSEGRTISLAEIHSAMGIAENMIGWGLPLHSDPTLPKGKWRVLWRSDLDQVS